MSRTTAVLPPDSRTPSPLSLGWLGFRVASLRILRGMSNVLHPLPRLSKPDGEFGHLTAILRTPLRRTDSPEELAMELGKIQNLRVAARALDGLVIPAGQTFSFWRQLGRCTRRKGYVAGRQLQEGCLVRAVGGGICQLSNALYEVALRAGAEIVERHPHTRIVPGSAAERDMDATVAWNHIDLRWRATFDLRLTVRLTADHMEVSLYRKEPSPEAQTLPGRRPLRTIIDPVAHACGLCERTDCHLHKPRAKASGRSAALVDEVWPEFDAYLAEQRGERDLLFLPIRGGKRSAYRWSTEGWAEVRDALWATLRRSFAARRLADQGAERQQARLRGFSELAEAYGRRLPADVTHLTVSLDLLPFLWQGGYLGGRTYDVLMTRHPIAELQRRLDTALALHPDRPLLGDFRAPEALARAEAEALRGARRLITPHSDVAKGDPRRYGLSWQLPKAPAWRSGEAIAFCGPTIARKGAYELREAIRHLGHPLVRMGRDLEGVDFWKGLEVRRPLPGESWLNGVAVVVQPAVIEDRPRRLLEAIAAGCPVIATEACGVSGMPGVRIVEGTCESLVASLSTGNV